MRKLNVKGLLGTLWPLLGAVFCLLVLATLSMEIMSSVRSYVTGESLWSKGQKDAIFYLLEYARNRDEATFEAVHSVVTTTTCSRPTTVPGSESATSLATA